MPELDESTFQQVLRAAYVIQQHNELKHETPRKIDAAATLAVVAETQELLQSQHYDLNAAAKLIVERLGKITNATGIAIARIANDQLTYCAAGGTLTSLTGSSRPIGTSVSEFLREEEALYRTPDDVRSELLGKHDNSPVFFPVYRHGSTVALLQLSFPESESIQEHEIRSCQLMAGLLGEAISRAAEVEWKQSLAAERATMLEALERLRPQLERLAAESVNDGTSATAELSPVPMPSKSPAEPEPAVAAPSTFGEGALVPALSDLEFSDIVTDERLSSTCNNCGFQFSGGEKFCGRCGNRLSTQVSSTSGPRFDLGMQSTNGQEDREATALETVPEPLPDLIAEMPPPAVQPPLARLADGTPATEGSTALAVAHRLAESEPEQVVRKHELELVSEPEEPVQESPWSSATKAREWLQSQRRAESRWLVKHGGDVSVAIAALVLLLVLLGWNARPAQSKLARGRTPSQPSLTLFERMLVGLGLAEAPAAPMPMGNPNVQVWEDLHTGLYYCPGADLYGKTPGGKVTNQRDAELDQFEPAARKACE
jgi:hypothetical protein